MNNLLVIVHLVHWQAFVVVNIGHKDVKKFMKQQQKANKAIAKELGLIK